MSSHASSRPSEAITRRQRVSRVASTSVVGVAIRQPPRNLLRGIPGVTLVEPKEWELCCGSAGVYNLTQPEAAEKLGRRKAANLAATGATAIAAANPGCALQIAAYLVDPVPVYHPMTLLDASIRGALP